MPRGASLYLTHDAAEHGDRRARYVAGKRAVSPPGIERTGTRTHVFRM